MDVCDHRNPATSWLHAKAFSVQDVLDYVWQLAVCGVVLMNINEQRKQWRAEKMSEKVIPVRSVQMQEWYANRQIKRQERWADIAIMAIFTGFFAMGVLVGWAICQL